MPDEAREFCCGAAEISAADVLGVCDVTSLSATQRAWLTSCIGGMDGDQDTLRELLYFATATPNLPSSRTHGGTGSRLRFVPSAMGQHHLPVAHTCSNTVDLPRDYASFEQLDTKLRQAIAATRQLRGFQFA
tara:strand:+ start:654 stop:1049 length:396 start_codon:yes stop_codon:yes gene_type:complete